MIERKRKVRAQREERRHHAESERGQGNPDLGASIVRQRR
jgi:hypothetical protein